MMKNKPCSLAVDGSNDTELEKMNPLTVRIYDVNRSKVQLHLLDMCCTSGENSAEAATIFDKINEKIEQYGIPWDHCVAFGEENISVNLGWKYSIKYKVKGNWGCGCQCYLVHNIACRASEAFKRVTRFDVEDFCGDIYYWLDKSTEKKDNP